MGKVETFTLDMPNFSQRKRKVWVYLPDSYFTSKKKFDVLYMFDGHNLFFDELATYGKSWGLKDYLDENKIDLVVIGQDCNHIGNRRISEYLPYKDELSELESIPKVTPKGKQTAEWFANTLKPYCEKKYRIHSDRKHIAIGGSSLGGLMSEYMICAYNNLYSKAICVSPSTHFNYQSLTKLINNTNFLETTLYIDQGSQEVHGKRKFIDAMDMMLKINHTYNQKGVKTYPHLTPGGHHSEADWEKVIPVFIPYIFPNLFKK